MLKRWILGVACMATVTGCYPERSLDSAAEFGAVTTLFDTTANFNAVTRYALPDSVIYLQEDRTNEVPAATQAAILSQLRQNLNALGWTEVVDARTNPVDVYVTALITTAEYVYYYWDYWYYWGWYGDWPLSAGATTQWYYPSYWYAYSYSTGTVLISMIDAHNISNNRVPLIWSSAVNGVLSDVVDEPDDRPAGNRPGVRAIALPGRPATMTLSLRSTAARRHLRLLDPVALARRLTGAGAGPRRQALHGQLLL